MNIEKRALYDGVDPEKVLLDAGFRADHAIRWKLAAMRRISIASACWLDPV
jgi:hypothetical protein